MSITIVGLLVLIASQFVPTAEVEVVVEAVGIILAWYGRYRAGGITIAGLRR